MTSTRNLTEARNLMIGQLVDFDQLPDARIVSWDGPTVGTSFAYGQHRVTGVQLTAAGRRTFVWLDNGRRVEILSHRKLVVLDRDLLSRTEEPLCDHTGETVNRTRNGYLNDIPAGHVEKLCVDCGTEL